MEPMVHLRGDEKWSETKEDSILTPKGGVVTFWAIPDARNNLLIVAVDSTSEKHNTELLVLFKAHSMVAQR